ncbi:MAG: lipoate--protein ligase family protein [Methanobacteriota archaeon]|nr:MAG: lipoate--protein ligase family protein [Euryarchaeota archaeon]
MTVWRIVDSGPLPTARSAAVDEAVLESHGLGLVPDTLHFYSRAQPTVSLGRFQKVTETVDMRACKARGVAIVRRRSGGGSIYTDSGQLMFAVITSQTTLGNLPHNSFETVCGALASALSRMGVDARYRPVNDIEIGGRKVSGSAQLRRRGSVLHHGTILVDTDLETMDLVLRNQTLIPSERVTTLSRVLGAAPDIEIVKRHATESIEEALGARFERNDLTDGELRLIDEYVESFYGRDDWNLKL